jgi:hypothetical protein
MQTLEPNTVEVTL